jgi:hypothetical protein
MKNKWAARLLLAGLLAGSAAAETAASESPFSLRGFGTIGLARSSSGHAEFVRDLSQPVGIGGGQWSGRIDSILGLQANWQATREVELVGQAVSRLRYDRSHDPEVMWAFAKWEPDPRVALRAGRIGADFMMLADSRLVGYSYLPVRPPPDFFGPLFFSHFDGADASVAVPLGRGVLRGKAFGGWTREKSAGDLGIWDTSGSALGGVVVDYLQGAWQFRLNAARIEFAADMNVDFLRQPLSSAGFHEAARSLGTAGTAARFLALGAVYDAGPLQAQAMLNRIRNESASFQDSHAGYLLIGYRVRRLTPFLGASWWKTRGDAGLPAIADPALGAAYRRFVAGSQVDRATYSLGVRYDIGRNLAAKLQWDAVRATRDTVFSVRNPSPAWDGRTDVLSLAIDFVF